MAEPDPPARPDLPEGGLRLDDSAPPAPYGLVQPQEQPPFDADDADEPFAMAEDRSATRSAAAAPDGAAAADGPVSMTEREPAEGDDPPRGK